VKLGGGRGNLPAVGDKGRAISAAERHRKAEHRTKGLAPTIAELRAQGATSLRQIAEGLNERGITTAQGGRWSAVQVQRLGL
jgi:Recombinase